MNPLIVTIVIALGTFIPAIFGANWLNQQAMNKRIDDLKTYLDARFEAVDARFDAVEQRITNLENRLDQRITNLESRLDQRIGSLENRIERIERQLDQIFKPSLPRN